MERILSKTLIPMLAVAISLMTAPPMFAEETTDDNLIELSELYEDGGYEDFYFETPDYPYVDMDEGGPQQRAGGIGAWLLNAVVSYGAFRVWEVVRNTQISNGWVSESRILKSGSVWAYKSNRKWVYGWQRIDNTWYFFNKDGWMFDATYHSRFQIVGPDPYGDPNLPVYEFRTGGPLVENEGWKRASADGSEWAYWVPGSYGAVRNNWRLINGRWYNFNNKAYVWKNEGWKKYKNKWMYFVPGSYGAYQNTTVTIGGEIFKFDSNGYCYSGRGC